MESVKLGRTSVLPWFATPVLVYKQCKLLVLIKMNTNSLHCLQGLQSCDDENDGMDESPFLVCNPKSVARTMMRVPLWFAISV
jgi:hypothetical protein